MLINMKVMHWHTWISQWKCSDNGLYTCMSILKFLSRKNLNKNCNVKSNNNKLSIN